MSANLVEATASYFTENAVRWINDAYDEASYNYPVGFHRVRTVKEIISNLDQIKNVIDIGCGGGHLSLELAQQGYNVLGIDQSQPMIEYANSKREMLELAAKLRLQFKLMKLEDVINNRFDALTAMGLIGYLNNDKELFTLGNKILRDKGYMIVSFRNRLFNLFSISHRTIQEAEKGDFNQLVEETAELYQKIDSKSVQSFIENLHYITGKILTENMLNKTQEPKLQAKDAENNFTFTIEARQSTPNEVIKTASDNGFITLNLYGIHPHIGVPGLNKMLPPKVYNLLSDSLLSFQKDPISLLWSSVFIGVFQKV